MTVFFFRTYSRQLSLSYHPSDSDDWRTKTDLIHTAVEPLLASSHDSSVFDAHGIYVRSCCRELKLHFDSSVPLVPLSRADKFSMLNLEQIRSIAQLSLNSGRSIEKILDSIHPQFWGHKFEGFWTGKPWGPDRPFAGLDPDGDFNA